MVDFHAQWRQQRYVLDEWNRLRNTCSKTIGEKKKKKEPEGEADIPGDFAFTHELSADTIRSLTVNQIKSVRNSMVLIIIIDIIKIIIIIILLTTESTVGRQSCRSDRGHEQEDG